MRMTRPTTLAALTLAAIAVPSGLIAATAGTASASATGFGPKKCTPLENGDLCAAGVSGSPNGYDASYHKVAGSPVTLRFALECKNGFVKADNGPFSLIKGNTGSFVFSVGNQGECRVHMHDYTNGGDFRTPYVTVP